MDKQGNDSPQIVTHKIPKIEVFQISDDELRRINDRITQVGQDFSFMLTSFSIGITLIFSLMTGAINPEYKLVFKVAVGMSIVVTLYTGIKWIRYRKSTMDVISRIRDRRENPEG